MVQAVGPEGVKSHTSPGSNDHAAAKRREGACAKAGSEHLGYFTPKRPSAVPASAATPMHSGPQAIAPRDSYLGVAAISSASAMGQEGFLKKSGRVLRYKL